MMGRGQLQTLAQRTNRTVTICVTVVTLPAQLGGNFRFPTERISSRATSRRRKSRDSTITASQTGTLTRAG